MGGEEAMNSLEKWLFDLDAPLPGESFAEPTDADLQADAQLFLAAARG